MNTPWMLWITRALWLALPFTLLDHIISSAADATAALRVTTQVVFWVLWAATFLVSLVPLPSTLTALRVLTPLAPLASVIASIAVTADVAGWAGLALGTLAAALAFSAAVGDWFVDGASYGDERRFALKPPVALVAGPLQLAWILTVAPLLAGILLFAGGAWIAGAPLVVVGIVTAWWGSFALWRLARRWLVFVPAGMTLVDDMAIAEPVLVPSRSLRRFGPAHVGSQALDLTVGAPGLVLQADMSTPVELVPAAPRGGTTEAAEVASLLVVPSRPATVLDHAEGRGLPVSRT